MGYPHPKTPATRYRFLFTPIQTRLLLSETARLPVPHEAGRSGLYALRLLCQPEQAVTAHSGNDPFRKGYAEFKIRKGGTPPLATSRVFDKRRRPYPHASAPRQLCWHQRGACAAWVIPLGLRRPCGRTPLQRSALAAWHQVAYATCTQPRRRAEMTKKTATLAWNGLTLEISIERNAVLSCITGEEYASLKATNPANASKSLFNDALPVSLIQSAGGAVNFVDVMLSAAQAA